MAPKKELQPVSSVWAGELERGYFVVIFHTVSNLPRHGCNSLNCCEQTCFNYEPAQVNLIPPPWYTIASCIIGHYVWTCQSQQQLWWWFISSAVKVLVHDYIASQSLNQTIGKLPQYWFITLHCAFIFMKPHWQRLTFEELMSCSHCPL